MISYPDLVWWYHQLTLKIFYLLAKSTWTLENLLNCSLMRPSYHISLLFRLALATALSAKWLDRLTISILSSFLCHNSPYSLENLRNDKYFTFQRHCQKLWVYVKETSQNLAIKILGFTSNLLWINLNNF